ncbi:ADP-ribosylglycohydrolase family protein [Oryzibacter oryziterrae]|uniref:ADP-ribosylglycohydrolase family protein n=1 Tax=Oryzibacter oryziterrae TaxID=2766474 RepID=UPI001F3E7116|nr:ADP-ribosylglycohydrolase family protein [Oryzibacter oryziterrae]
MSHAAARTSKNHPLQIAELVVGPGFGRIGITFCPGKKDPQALTGAWDRDLGVDLDAIAAWGASAIVTLVEAHELEDLKVPMLGREVERRHMAWLHLPIADVTAPGAAFEALWHVHGPGIRARLRDGFNVLVHCKGGLGRAGTIAARLAAELGMAPQTAVEQVRAVRKGAIETTVQFGHVLAIMPVMEAAPAQDEASRMDRAVGALVGLAVGDALGTTLEFARRNDKAERLTDMIGGGPFHLQPGGWTDDTAMALALTDSLQVCESFDARDLMQRFEGWMAKGDYIHTGVCFDIGNTTRAAIREWMATGNPMAGSTDPHSAGNGSLMRLAPVAIRHWNDPEVRRSVAAGQSQTTHGAAEAVDACVLFADMLAEAIAGAPREAVLAPRSFAGSERIAAIAAGCWRGKHRNAISGSGYVVDALEAALWCIGSTMSFREAILMAANLRDDADTTAAIAGQLAGALYGLRAIPPEWRDKLAWRPRIEGMAEGLWRKACESRA